MTVIDKEAAKMGANISNRMSLSEASACYLRGEKALSDVVPDKTPS